MRQSRLLCSLFLIMTLLSVPAQVHANTCQNQDYSECPGGGSWSEYNAYCDPQDCGEWWIFVRECRVRQYYTVPEGGPPKYKDCERGCWCIFVKDDDDD